MRPTVFVGVRDDQATGFGGFLETAVVVGVTPAAILYAHLVIVIMHHFMQESGGNLFNGTGQRSGSNVDLMRAAQLGDPGILPKREMPVGFRSRLYRDGGS